MPSHEHLAAETLMRQAAEPRRDGPAGCPRCDAAVASLRRALPTLRELGGVEPVDVPPLPAALLHATRGRAIAGEILEAAERHDAEDLRDALARHADDPALAAGALQALQLAAKVAPRDPVAALDLATFLGSSAEAVARGSVAASTLAGEAALLESQVLLVRGEAEAARASAARGLELLRQGGADAFALARADYFAASAAGFCGEVGPAIERLDAAAAVFESFGQDDWVARAFAARALAMTMERDDPAALRFFDRALRRLTRPEDANNAASILQNKALLLVALDRRAEALATFEACLETSLRHGLRSIALTARVNLLALTLEEGRPDVVLEKGARLLEQARAERLAIPAYVARLLLAEASLSLGKVASADRVLEELAAAAPTALVRDESVVRALAGLTAAQRSAAEAGRWLRRVRRHALGWGEREAAAS